MGHDSLRALAAPLATFLPGAAITLAVIELSTHHVVSGASRLVAGFMQIAQLAFGILIAAQVAGVADNAFVTTEINQLGAWAPLVGVVVLRPRRHAQLRSADVVPAVDAADAAHRLRRPVGRATEWWGSYASGFGGGLTLIVFALAISHRPNTPPTVSLILPGFWLLVPGSLGFMGVTELDRHAQHRGCSPRR